jgi:hypothetical protein
MSICKGQGQLKTQLCDLNMSDRCSAHLAILATDARNRHCVLEYAIGHY